MNDFIRIKNQFDTIADIPEEQMKALLKLTSRKKYYKDDYFVKASELQDNIGFVSSGLFRVYYIDYHGKEYTKNFLGQNDFVAAYSSMLQGQPSKLYIQALEDSEVLLISYSGWMNLIDAHICWQIVFRKITENAYLVKEKRESDLLFYSAELRYLNFVKDFPELINKVKQKYIASFLGMSPETLSRIKSKTEIDKCQ